MVKSKRGQDADEDDDWLDDDDDDELNQEEEGLAEEFMNTEQEERDDATIKDLLDAIENLEGLEHEDGTLGRNAVMKVCLIMYVNIYSLIGCF